ncbi:hypothetical protein, conserved [Eimeria maxima]|uniref:Uncharacterized protein n=1 Tax=Eimeria maxima TaxID=5804 RepID=U6MG40_EIMMA|nr:hypothetical protein, conserved [Eimeria maxima]CDJ60600.1 hypothetical protein, conserved [Eimeria maxima]
MPSSSNELEAVSFSFGELQPLSRVSNDFQSRVYIPGSISIENDGASPGETDSSHFVWNTATVSTTPSLSSTATARPKFTPAERFPLSEGRLRHNFGTDSAHQKFESPVAKKFNRLHTLAKSDTYWLGLTALAILIALNSALDPLRSKLLRVGCKWAKTDGTSLQLSWDDDFIPRMPGRLGIQASRASEVPSSSQTSFHTEFERKTYHGFGSDGFNGDGLLFSGSSRRPNESEGSFGPVKFSENPHPVFTLPAAESSHGPLHRVVSRSVSKFETWRLDDAKEAREGTAPQLGQYSPHSVYDGSPSEPDSDHTLDRGSGYSTPTTDASTDDVPSNNADSRMGLARGHSESDSSSSNNSGGHRNGQSRTDRKRISNLQNRQRVSGMHGGHHRGSEVVEMQPKGHRKRIKVSRHSRVGTASTTEKQTAQSGLRRRGQQRSRRSARNSLSKRQHKVPSVNMVFQTPKKTRFFLPDSNVASGDASGEDDDSDENEATSVYSHIPVPSGSTDVHSQSGESALTLFSVDNGDESSDGGRTTSLPHQSSQSAFAPSSTTTGPGDFAVVAAARLLASRVSPDASFNLPKNQQASYSGSNNASSLPTEVLLYLVRQALEELVLSENAK